MNLRLLLSLSFRALSPLLPKESVQQLCALVGEHAALNSAAVIHARVIRDLVKGAAASGFRILRTEDYTPHAALNKSSGTHNAGFESNEDSAAVETP